MWTLRLYLIFWTLKTKMTIGIYGAFGWTNIYLYPDLAWWVLDLAARGLLSGGLSQVAPSYDKNPKLERRAPKYPRITSTNCPNDSAFGFCNIMRVNYHWIMMICYIPKVYDHVRFTNGPLRYDLHRQVYVEGTY